MEINFSHFQVERSTDGKTFKVMKQVPGQGNTVDYHAYHYEEAASSAIQYYRLKQIDQGKTFEYSSIVSVPAVCKANLQAELFPNPVTDILQLAVHTATEERTQLQILNHTGQVVKVEQLRLQAGSNKATININELPASAYILRLEGASTSTVLPFVKQ